jgi:uncharacterized membrane protein
MPNNDLKKDVKNLVDTVQKIKPVPNAKIELKKIKETVNHTLHIPETQKLTFGERAADSLTKWAGSWTFIILFFVFLATWMILNVAGLIFGIWDKYPFILLNLVLSCLAAIQAPIILMSQNRTGQKDRQRSEYDYSINRRSMRDILDIKRQLNRIEKRLNN